MGRLGCLALWLVVAAPLALVLPTVEVGGHLRQTCVICRLNRVDYTYCGLRWTSFEETDCSRWYEANVEPVHAQRWERSSCRTMINLLGQRIGWACTIDISPIWSLPPTTQLDVYQHFKAPTEAKGLFLSLSDPLVYKQRLDGDDEVRGRLIVTALMEWEMAGYPRTWDEYWGRFYQKHIEERMEWRNSGGGVCFWEWQEERKRQTEDSHVRPRLR